MKAKLSLYFDYTRHIVIPGKPWLKLAKDSDVFVGRQDVPHQMGEGGDADHLIGAHVVGLAGAAVLQQDEEPMG